MIKGIVFAETKFVPLLKAAVPLTDLTVQRGTGLFETMRTYNKLPLALSERLARLRRSAKFIGFRQVPPARFIESKIYAGLKKVKFREALIKIILTGGDSHSLLPEGRARLFILFSPFLPWPAVYYRKGIAILTAKYFRTLPELKSVSYLSAVLAQKRARRAGYQEAVYVDETNCLLEGTTFNLALVKKNQLLVPRDGILEGVTMKIVIGLARRRGLRIVRRPVKLSELRAVDEAFITSATREVIPVIKIDESKIGNGKPGPFSKLLLADYREYAKSRKRN